MKKIFRRLIFVMVICLTSLFMQSEPRVTRLAASTANGCPKSKPRLKAAVTEKSRHPYDGFFTRI